MVYIDNAAGAISLHMQTTKSQILVHIKRQGGATVDQLARVIGLAAMTVRQHLTVLQRDGLVTSQEVRRSSGRPHFLYLLAEKGEEEFFPKRYDRLANLMLEEVAALNGEELLGLSPQEKKRLLLRKVVERVASEHGATMKGRDLPERVAEVTEILVQEGGFAEWRKSESGFEIIDYNCVYRKVAESHDEVCDWHVSLLAHLLGEEVRCEQNMHRGDGHCAFLVDELAGAASAVKLQS